MSNYGSPPVGGTGAYGASGYQPAAASSYPGMNQMAGGAAGIGAGMNMGIGAPQAGNTYPPSQSSYPGMVGASLAPQSQSRMAATSPIIQSQVPGSYGVSPVMTAAGVGRGAPQGVTLMSPQQQQMVQMQQQQQQQQQTPFTSPSGGSIQPGSVTYTTTQDPQGRTIYHLFRAEAAQYTSPQGVTYNGIQWVNAGTSSMPPSGASIAGPDFNASFNRGAGAGAGAYHEDSRAYRDWDKEEQKRRRKEEKEANKRAAHWEAQQIARERAEEEEFRRSHRRTATADEDAEILAARERDREIHQRTRRLSPASRGPDGFVAPGSGSVYPGAPGGAPYERERDRERSVYGGGMGGAAERELDRRLGDMSIGGGSRLNADYGSAAPPLGGPVGVRSRRSSMSMPAAALGGTPMLGGGRPGGGMFTTTRNNVYDDPDGYSDRERDRLDYDRGRDDYGAVGMGAGSRGLGLGGGSRGGPSPYRSTSPLPPAMGAGGAAVFPPGHIYEGMPINGAGGGGGLMLGAGGGAISRSHSPVPGTAPYASSALVAPGGGGGYGVSPRMQNMSMRDPMMDRMEREREQELAAMPESFSRPINRAQTFTAFEMMKILDMDGLLRKIPSYPLVLTTHDVMAEDWGRMMGDLSLAWQDRLPVSPSASGRHPKRNTVVSDLLDLWNSSFFLPRGVEIVLYKGRERRTGRGAGRPDTRLPRIDSDSESSSVSSDDDYYQDLDQHAHRRDGYSGDERDPAGGGRFGGQYYGGLYGGRAFEDDRLAAEMREARMTRRQLKEERRLKARVRKHKKKEQKKTYALYMCYVNPRDAYGSIGGGGAGGGGTYAGGFAGGGYTGGGYSGSGYASSGQGL